MDFKPTNFNELPIEVLEEIFLNLKEETEPNSNLKKNFFVYQRVCYLWRKILLPLSWISVPEGYLLENKKIPKKRAKYIKNLSWVELIKLQKYYKRFSGVNHIEVFIGTLGNDVSLLKLALENFHNLKTLVIEIHNPNIIDFSFLNFINKIKKFSLSSSTISTEILETTLASLSQDNLVELSLRVSVPLTNRIVEIISKKERLKMLSLSNAWFSDEVIDVEFSYLKVLELNFSENARSPNFFIRSESFPRLKSVSLFSESSGLNLQIQGQVWQYLHSLDLDYNFFYKLTNISILQNIKFLDLRKSTSPAKNYKVLNTLLAFLEKLVYLSVWEEIPDEVFDLPLKNYSLEYLNLTLKDPPLSPFFFRWLNFCLPRLKYLYLQHHLEESDSEWEHGSLTPKDSSTFFRRADNKRQKVKPKYAILEEVKKQTHSPYRIIKKIRLTSLTTFKYSHCLGLFPLYIRVVSPNLLVNRSDVCFD